MKDYSDMGDQEGSADLNLSNPPALKVGNMRVAQKHKETGEKPLSKAEYMKQAQEYNSELLIQPKHDFETQEELQFHDRGVEHEQRKPIPHVVKPMKPTHHFIHQPRKE